MRRLQRLLEGPNAQARLGALARVALLPLLLIIEGLENPQSPKDLPLEEPLIRFLLAYAVLSAIYAYRARRPVRLAPFACADALLLSLLVYAEGGATADARFALFVPVVVAAFVAGPRLTIRLVALSVAGYVAASVAHHLHGDHLPAEQIVINALDLAWRGGLAVTLSFFVTRRAEASRRLAESRRSLVTQALTAEARARRELSYALHDELVQALLCAGQDLKTARRGRPEYLDRAELAIGDAVERLRHEIFLLHPHQLETGGLGAALAAVAEHQAPAEGPRPVVTVAPDAQGVDDELLFSLGRELLTNAVRHADAQNVALDVQRDGAQIVVVCRDDGRGVTPGRRSQALAQGHLGLAACTERVEALGGSLELETAPGAGTVVRAAIPAERRSAPAGSGARPATLLHGAARLATTAAQG